MRRLLPQFLWIALCSLPLCGYSHVLALSNSEFSRFQATTVKGKVVDDTGVGMPGVNVIVKGTSKGTTTDADGVYSLELTPDQANGTLVFSFIGYAAQEQPLNNRTTVNVTMVADISELSEVVVV